MCTVCFATQGFNPANHTGTGPEFLSAFSETDISANLGAADGPPSSPVQDGDGTPDLNQPDMKTDQASAELWDPSIERMADYLTRDYWYYGPTGGNGHQLRTNSRDEVSVNIQDLTAEGQKLARWAFEAWESVANIKFVESTSFYATIRFNHEANGAFAQALSSPLNGKVSRYFVNVDKDWLDWYGSSLSSYSFSTYIHEIGHALGLGHQGNYNFTGSAVRFEGNALMQKDSYQYTVMSYFDQTDNPYTSASYALPMTPMMVDIIAVQNLYGAPGADSPTAGDTVFGANGNLGTYFDAYFSAIASGAPDPSLTGSGPVALTLFDVGGTDTLDIAFLSDNNRLDLRDERFSDLGGLIGNLGIARGTVIENAILGSGNDNVTGNAAANDIDLGDGTNVVYGLAGNDTLTGGAQSDELNGGDDNDLLNGGGADDALYGGRGNDTAMGGEGQDTLGGFDGDDSLDGGAGADQIWGANGNDTLLGGDGNDTLGATDGNDSAEGGTGDDAVWGARGNDTLRGDAGQDTLGGYYGNDSLDGGADDDELWGAWGEDTLLGGTGNDQLGAGDQNDRLGGQDGNDTLSGGRGNDTIDGGAGNDTIYGYTGADVITGGSGDDVIYGGLGADEFIFAAGFGNDTIYGFSTVDELAFDDALWSGTLNAAQVVSSFADDSTGTVIFDFGTGAMLTLAGVTSSVGLDATIDII